MDFKTILSDLYADRARLEKAIAALEALEGTASATAAPGRRTSAPAVAATPSAAPKRRGRRTMSAAARKRISEAAKKRWAERKKTPAGRTMSAAARKRISEAAKKRWAERKKAQKAA